MDAIYSSCDVGSMRTISQKPLLVLSGSMTRASMVPLWLAYRYTRRSARKEVIKEQAPARIL
jgi:hypothetical protein